YNLAAAFLGALGALASGVPETFAEHRGLDVLSAQRAGFLLYAAIAVVIFFVYRHLRSEDDPPDTVEPVAPRRALSTSRRTVLELAALFSLDSAGGGFVVTSLLVLWLQLRFDLSAGQTAAVF